MLAITFINDLQAALGHVKQNGQSVIPIERLENYLSDMKNIAIENGKNAEAKQQSAQKKLEHDIEVWKTQTNIQTTHSVEMFKSVIEAGLNALKSAIVVNGGAAVALLAFLASIIKIPSPANDALTNNLASALLIFLIGTGHAATASGTRYLSQAAFSSALQDDYNNKSKSCWNCIGKFFQILSIILGLVAYAAFYYGGWTAYQAFITR